MFNAIIYYPLLAHYRKSVQRVYYIIYIGILTLSLYIKFICLLVLFYKTKAYKSENKRLLTHNLCANNKAILKVS